MSIGDNMTSSTLEAADKAKNGSNSAFKSFEGITTDASDVDGLGDSRSTASGNRSCRQAPMLDFMCIMSSLLAEMDLTTQKTFRHSAFGVTKKKPAGPLEVLDRAG